MYWLTLYSFSLLFHASFSSPPILPLLSPRLHPSLPPSPCPSLSPPPLSHRSSKLREQAIEVVRDLLASHDSDSRYNKLTARARIASLYLPLLSTIMDLYPHLYKGADGWEDWSTTFERNATVRRSVVIKEGVDGGWDIEGQVRMGERRREGGGWDMEEERGGRGNME